jgi:hypothetical protein
MRTVPVAAIVQDVTGARDNELHLAA